MAMGNPLSKEDVMGFSPVNEGVSIAMFDCRRTNSCVNPYPLVK